MQVAICLEQSGMVLVRIKDMIPELVKVIYLLFYQTSHHAIKCCISAKHRMVDRVLEWALCAILYIEINIQITIY